jgi:transcriptional regulator with XRE-family HTH domain
MPTIDLTNDDPELEASLGPHDPRRRAVVRGGKLHGEELRAEIRRLTAQGKSQSEIAAELAVSRQHVSKIILEEPAKDRIPPALLARMVEHLRAGASPAELLDRLPEVAGLFRRRGAAGDAAPQRDRVLASLRMLISGGKDVESGPTRELYDARQAGRLVATPAERPQPSAPAKPRPRAK